jgi:replicative DNA helicase
MPTGIRRLDANTGGLPLGSVTLVLGETGAGKSTLAMSFARAAYNLASDIPLLFSYEDGQTSFARRALAQETGVPTWRIGARKFEPGQADRVTIEGMRRLGLRRERIAKFSGETVDQLCQTVRRLRAKGPSYGAKSIGRLVIVDYLQRIPKPRERWINSVPEAIQEISNRLEDLAATENIAVVLFAQVTDEVKKRGGVITDVRDCADGRAGGKGCKLALAIYRPAMYDKNARATDGQLLVIKNNQGESGVAVNVHLDLVAHSIRDAEDL